MSMKRSLGLLLVLAALLLVGCTSNVKSATAKASDKVTSNGIMFKNPGCGCCGLYSQYMEKSGISLEIKEAGDMDSIKAKYGVPYQLQSCHTTIIGDYFVEGHVPYEAIEKLLAEKPDIKGIAMAGMPSGSPGMPGSKTEPFIIYAISHDGTIEEFMRI